MYFLVVSQVLEDVLPGLGIQSWSNVQWKLLVPLYQKEVYHDLNI